MKFLRWLLVFLYLAVLAGLIVFAWDPTDFTGLFIFSGIIALQFLFFALRGNIRSLQPVHRRQIMFPVIVASLMMAALLATTVVALWELFDWDEPDSQFLIWAMLIASWCFWFFVCLVVVVGRSHYMKAVRRLILTAIGGSLLQLLVTVPAHVIVSRRPGCFVGMATGLGLVAGVCVLVWAFGPGIVLLFIHEAHKQQAGHCPGCGYNLRGLEQLRCPECGRTFTLREIRLTAEELTLGRPLVGVAVCARCSADNAVDAARCRACGDWLVAPGPKSRSG